MLANNISFLSGNGEHSNQLVQGVQHVSGRQFISSTQLSEQPLRKETTRQESSNNIKNNVPGEDYSNSKITGRNCNSSSSSTLSFRNPFDAVVDSFSSSLTPLSTTSPVSTQGGISQTGAALGPSQQGVLSNPFSSVAVPAYSNLSQHPLEQPITGGRMAAPSASLNTALGQPPPATNANSAMSAHSVGWQR